MPRVSHAQSWSEAETTLLIALYGEQFAALEKMSKKKPIFLKIASKLLEMGFQRTGEQVSKKIANLRSEYRKNTPGPTGGAKPTWVHYEALHKILHQRPALNSDAAEVSEVGFEIEETGEEDTPNENEAPDQTNPDENREGEAPSPVDTQPPKKRARLSEDALKICAETLEFMKTQADTRATERAEMRQTDSQLLQILGRIATSSETVANAVSSGNVTILQPVNLQE